MSTCTSVGTKSLNSSHKSSRVSETLESESSPSLWNFQKFESKSSRVICPQNTLQVKSFRDMTRVKSKSLGIARKHRWLTSSAVLLEEFFNKSFEYEDAKHDSWLNRQKIKFWWVGNKNPGRIIMKPFYSGLSVTWIMTWLVWMASLESSPHSDFPSLESSQVIVDKWLESSQVTVKTWLESSQHCPI